MEKTAKPAGALISLGLALASPAIARAQTSDPAAQTVNTLDNALLSAMKTGKSTTAEERYRRLAPTVQRAFDLPRMIRFVCGAAWSRMSPSDQATLTTAFGRYTTANYAHNFSSYGGQKFVIDGVQTRLPDKLVRTELTSPSGSPVVLSYRMQQSGGEWKILDVYFTGSISELAQQSSDFASTLARGGAAALAKKLNDQSDQLLRG